MLLILKQLFKIKLEFSTIKICIDKRFCRHPMCSIHYDDENQIITLIITLISDIYSVNNTFSQKSYIHRYNYNQLH